MQSILSSLLMCFFMVAGFSATVWTRDRETGFLNRTVKVGSEVYRYQVYVPQQWSRQRKWPVILFLHGAGERGSDGFIQTEVGIAKAIRIYNDRFPVIVVMPQCRKDVWWPAEAMQGQALASLEQAVKEFHGDRARLYLTGLSMGGYGTWAIAAKHPGLFAALTPICGGVKLPERLRAQQVSVAPAEAADPYGYIAGKVGRTPVWIFHGGDDKTVPPGESIKMNQALQAAGGQVKYTEYPGVGHNSWDKAYAEPEWIRWILSQRLTK